MLTTVIVNYKTLDLVRICFESFRLVYPSIPVLLIDNGSCDASTKYIRNLAGLNGVSVLLNKVNVGHGPALHQAMGSLKGKYVFTLDSDCRIIASGFLEKMLCFFHETREMYAVGKLFLLNKIGGHTGIDGEPYVHPFAALFDREKYHKLVPFNHHGAPAVLNMRSAIAQGYRLSNFPIREYVYHAWKGTRGKHGVPNWDGNAAEALPENAKTAEQMLRGLR